MLAETQDEVYFTRMKSSLGDKTRMVEHLIPGSVLDVGSGGGEFAAAVRDAGWDVATLDGSAEACAHAHELGVETVQAFSHDAADIFPEHSFTNITCSSIIHEIYSYGNDEPNSAYTLSSVHKSVDAFRRILTIGGRLIIRDGIMPDDWADEVEVTLTAPDGPAALYKYLDMVPFRGESMRAVNLTLKPGTTNTFVGTMESAMEFLYTYTWGVQNYPRETQELYGVFTLADYTQFLETEGFEVIFAEQYLQPGYPANLEGKAVLTKNGAPAELPSSNCLIVAERKN
jgi:SAM-dependent methyltransferase